MKSCNHFYSSCLPFIFGSQAGIGSDYSLKQRGRNDGTNSQSVPSMTLITSWYLPLHSSVNQGPSLQSEDLLLLNKKVAILLKYKVIIVMLTA